MSHMMLSDYIKGLQGFMERQGDMPVVYSRDDAENGYSPVQHDPSLFWTNDLSYFIDSICSHDDKDSYWDEEDEPFKVCVVN